ncbi:hypothetical protein PR048_007401 [Dryococelus australis]|uniref:Receptor ligand binding region domain-containing protein n=1 Tax=Dryococelus australis TaxID=614101 RepID=A0ABQ9HUK5_9NEOP|nr:hypothetical protein PR048_007401 [Dryococelus australis]
MGSLISTHVVELKPKHNQAGDKSPLEHGTLRDISSLNVGLVPGPRDMLPASLIFCAGTLYCMHSGSPCRAVVSIADTIPWTMLQCEISGVEVRLEPGAREMLHAVRALLLAAHWHQFTALVDYSASSSVLLRRDLASIFSAAPLSPTIHAIRADAPHQALFRYMPTSMQYSLLNNPCADGDAVVHRRLADVSRATRGVVVLICDLRTAERIASEARRLNMMDGHFVWLWVDTNSATAAEGNSTYTVNQPARHNATRPRAYHRTKNRKTGSLYKGEGYVFHICLGVVCQAVCLPGRWRRLGDDGRTTEDDGVVDSLPVGLLALRPRAVRLDRQLVRGAAKVLVDAVRRVLTLCVDSMPAPSAVDYRVSCWEQPPHAYRNFSALFVSRTLRSLATAQSLNSSILSQALSTSSHSRLRISDMPSPEAVLSRHQEPRFPKWVYKSTLQHLGLIIKLVVGRLWKRVAKARFHSQDDLVQKVLHTSIRTERCDYQKVCAMALKKSDVPAGRRDISPVNVFAANAVALPSLRQVPMTSLEHTDDTATLWLVGVTRETKMHMEPPLLTGDQS